ncbi:hypothetical protein QQX98_000452 [Neonectria punicea]|uniref:Fungal N-terminal domain-containing protein n=1 Tax=Neonectria punicea TaxID=979145 RepID=A0ABR1HUI4_9HYPO
MAEPVGITGTAAGLVSLGLQLYGEISKYLDAVESRQRDLDFARRQTTTLQQCLDAVRLATSTPKKNNATTSKTVNSCVVACEDELKALEALVTRLTGPKTQENTPSAKLRDKGRQYAFRFHRESILELEAKLSATNGVLQTALQTLGLNVSLATSEAVSGVKSTLVAIRITEDESQTKIDNLSKPISDIQTSYIRADGPTIRGLITDDDPNL